ncbi:MAG: DNA-binding protein [Blastocatellia bacterium]|nr:DNA-binding protein [Blastocatellia bacterium]MBN8725673.1 DNA-binding protein [Acidobacteriota bacterium]
MSSITINIPDESYIKLKEVANNLKITPEELVKMAVDEVINSSQKDFNNVIDYVLSKNKELYKRLA